MEEQKPPPRPIVSIILFSSQLSEWLVLHEGLDSLIGSKTKILIELCCSTVALFGTLPEESVVIAEERSVLHLALVFENGVTLESKFLGTDKIGRAHV